MNLDHCHRASCTQIIEALRAENARLILLEGQHEFNHSRYLNLCRDLAACQRERDDASRTSEYWKSLALAITNDSSALEARLAQEREKIPTHGEDDVPAEWRDVPVETEKVKS